ncbi:MAG TPA: hypothetical protein PKO41_06760 [Dokdonella sp.]|uniref:hypothetical protein n=1 Tax=Dokdonella sp. TaxID=2291710 RepID=UPI0025C19550|nr:hypothetical protein [Dokdonella sp.]MBX3690554.1 hypothetical protein [Dokdonella sp.]HNR92108.1 hypothetical protein [Dokdonella sp.]
MTVTTMSSSGTTASSADPAEAIGMAAMTKAIRSGVFTSKWMPGQRSDAPESRDPEIRGAQEMEIRFPAQVDAP